jgi:hypothetical protein
MTLMSFRASASDRFARAHARIQSEMKEAKIELVRIQAKYETFKKYKARTAINK